MEEHENNLVHLLEVVQRGRGSIKWLKKNDCLFKALCKHVLRVNRGEDGELPEDGVISNRIKDALR